MRVEKGAGVTKKNVVAWCLYDWANSAFSTVVLTFVFSLYFSKSIVGDSVEGSALWGYTIASAGICVAILGPLVGVLLDARGRYRVMLRVFTLLSISCVAGLFFMLPNRDFIYPALILVALAFVSFELAQIVYNAMLPRVVRHRYIGRVSGWAWGLGYVGGLVCLALALFGLIGLENDGGFLSIPTDEGLNVRASVLLTAFWFLIFALPLMMFGTGARPGEVTHARNSVTLSVMMAVLMATILKVRDFSNVFRFLIASALYRDGLATLFAMGGLYAQGSFGMSLSEVLMFGIGLNVSAGLGAFVFSFMDDRFGSKRVILIGLAALIALGGVCAVVQDVQAFMIAAVLLGVFVGPVQAASRSMLARISPEGKTSEMFGLYALTGKSIAFLGPLVFAMVTEMFESQRAGIASIIAFWVIGGIILWRVREERFVPLPQKPTE